MKIQLWPKTMSGKASITFISISIALVIGIITVAANLENESMTGGFFSNMPLALITLSAFACAVISFISGLVSTFKRKERSILLFICLAICVLFIYFGIAQIVGEIMGTH